MSKREKTKITEPRVQYVLDHKSQNLKKLREETGLNEYIIGEIVYCDRVGLRGKQKRN